MANPLNAKKILGKFKEKTIEEFYLDSSSTELILPQDSSIPWVGAAKRNDVFQKQVFTRPESSAEVSFIRQNGHEHAILWKSSAEKIKEATRWGIIKTDSLTSKIIGSLGQYRVIAHEQAAKGLANNSLDLKLRLVGHYQDLFEAMQDLESLVNRNNSAKKIEKYFERYIQKLEGIQRNLDTYFSDIDCPGYDSTTLRHLREDISASINRARSFSQKIKNSPGNLRRFNRGRGHESILEFIKQQINQNLYQLQGINQDISFSTKRYFALTRGNLNDFIEDARKELDDHLPDLRNPVNPCHHGVFAINPEKVVTYDFGKEELSPARERQVLLAISFIEGWDSLELKKGEPARVKNHLGEEELDTIAATRWKTHRGFIPQLKSIAYFLLNFVKSVVLPTKAWEEETWKNKGFHLVAAELRAHAKPNQPIWVAPYNFFKKIAYAIRDIFSGIRDFGANLVFRLPAAMLEDWQASSTLPELNETLSEVSKECQSIKEIEGERLEDLLKRCGIKKRFEFNKDSILAEASYPLTAGEQNDILTAVARGLNGFSSFFTHGFNKDPISGVIFTLGYAVGAAVIFMPAFSTAIFGAGYVNWLSHFSYALGTSKIAATVGGGCTQAQILAMGWDAIMHGPSGVAANAAYQFGEDPLTIAAYCAAAYGIGHLLINGIAGHKIPWLSNVIAEDLGTNKSFGTFFFGGKVGVMSYEALVTEAEEHIKANVPVLRPEDIKQFKESFYAEHKPTIDRFMLAYFLSSNAEEIPKLDSRQLFELSRQIDKHFSREDSRSLKKILYPEGAKPSIAFQLFSLPLSYIPAICRFAWSIVLSLAAWTVEKPHPWEPVKRAGGDLFEKTKRDLTRLITFASSMTFLFYSGFSSLIKSFVYTFAMGIARIAAVFGAKPGHSTHNFFAAAHNFMRQIGEFLYPVRAVKDVTIADPRATIEKTEASYAKLLKQIYKSRKDNPGEVNNLPDEQDSADYSFDLRGTGTASNDNSAGDADPVHKQKVIR
ncbi:hypothetical protein Lbir_2055 [Legionella birminghamensis]|uniref:Uncharacterized protein n=1 Tax=Legionella birminghamensis TaxID=28083 RepID=A0A378I8N2_9GAMM|nr:hypothetical protein [Legionella birminghamensis]KTC69316.1 hypothetical protein Lbir_2055 [Legionella birminghamensis]STX31578.1 Uncharacterised protein [Legionella birminghamensis]